MSTGGTHWRGDIQGLRAIAVGLVVAAHANFPRADGGFIGVDVFFVISGFLITSLLVREQERSGTISLIGFYGRRARRILPAATVTILGILAYAAWKLPAARTDAFSGDAGWSTVFLANVHFAKIGTDYFADVTDPSPFQHFWSLAVEEQFYLVWPLLMLLLLRRLRRPLVVVAVAVLVVASLAWSVYGVHHDPQLAYFSSLGRGYELGIGGLLALLGTRIAVPVRVAWPLGVGSLALLAFATLAYDGSTPFPGLAALVPVLATAGLLLAGLSRSGEHAVGVSRLLGVQPFRYLGDISYSLYLWHWPFLVLRPVDSTAGNVALAFVAAIASHHLIEKPFLSRLPKLRLRWSLVLWPATLALVLAGTVAANGWTDHRTERDRAAAEQYFKDHPQVQTDKALPASTRPETLLRQALALADAGAPIPPAALDYDPKKDRALKRFTCFAQGYRDRVKICPTGDLSAKKTVVLFGDSHANTWLESLRTLGERDHFKLVPFIKLGCAPYQVRQVMASGVPFDACASFRTWALQQIAALKPDAIFVGARGLLLMDPDDPLKPREAWAQGVETTLTALQRITPNVSAFADYPARGERPEDCVSAPGADQRSCVVRQRSNENTSNLAGKPVVDRLGVSWVDLTGLACVDKRCPLVVGDKVIYNDSAHLSPAWIRLNFAYVAQVLRSAMR